MSKFPSVCLELQIAVACGCVLSGQKEHYIKQQVNMTIRFVSLGLIRPWTLEVCSSIAVTDRDFFQQAGQVASGCISWDFREVEGA